MVRRYVRKTNNKIYDIKTIVEALKSLKERKRSLRQVARDHSMKTSALAYHWRRHNKENIDIEENVVKKWHSLRVLSTAVEQELLSCIIMCAEVYSTVGTTWIRQLAYELALERKVQLPLNWRKRKIAGRDWFLKFKERHATALAQNFSGTTSLARIIETHRHKTDLFESNYNKVLLKHSFEPKDVYVLEQCKIQNEDDFPVDYFGQDDNAIKEQDTRETSKIKGKSLTTFVGTVSAIGQSIPPFYIFSHAYYHNHQLLQDAPKGSIAKSDPSGAMTKKIFLDYLKHVVEYVGCSEDKPVLLLTDDHPYHMSLSALKFAKKNGIVIFSYPSRIKNKVRLLEQSMFPHVKIEDFDEIDILEGFTIEEDMKLELFDLEECVNLLKTF